MKNHKVSFISSIDAAVHVLHFTISVACACVILFYSGYCISSRLSDTKTHIEFAEKIFMTKYSESAKTNESEVYEIPPFLYPD